jgi:hypothetical protein
MIGTMHHTYIQKLYAFACIMESLCTCSDDSTYKKLYAVAVGVFTVGLARDTLR